MKPIYLIPLLLIVGCARHNPSTQPYVETKPQADIETLINAEAERLYAVFRAPKEAKALWGPKPKVGSDGVALAIRDLVVRNANDSEGLEFLDSTKVRRAETGWMQIVKVRGKNGFGAKVVNHRGFLIFNEKIILDFEENLFDSYIADSDKVEAEDKADWDMALQTATLTVKAKFKMP
jgi:hypothetical protein